MGVIQPHFICYRIYQSHLQSILLVMPCYSPTKILEKMRSIGKAELFAGIFEPYTAAKPKCMAPSQIGVGRYGFCRTGVVMDWSNKSDEIYFNHFYYNKTTKTACFTRRTTPSQTRTQTQKKRTQAVRILEFS